MADDNNGWLCGGLDFFLFVCVDLVVYWMDLVFIYLFMNLGDGFWPTWRVRSL